MSKENRYFWTACRIPMNLGLDIESNEALVDMETTSHRVPRTWVPDIDDEVEECDVDDTNFEDGFQFYSFTSGLKEPENKESDEGSDRNSDANSVGESDVDSNGECSLHYESIVDSDKVSSSDSESDIDF